MRKFPYVLVLIGIIILAYPKATEWYYEAKQERLMEAWEMTYTAPAPSSVQANFEQLSDIFLQPPASNEETPEETELGASDPSDGKEQQGSGPDPIATLIIDKIDLMLPILEGASEENMKYAATHMEETSPFGEIGNAAVAAHRVRKKGRLFNRLDELSVGDDIIVNQQGEQYLYTVFNVSRVEPTDVSVLNRNDQDKILTLITCDPIVNPTHRIIVHAKMEN
ncbi:hypothetical protein J2TS4_33990 [Paenibacillus sp. J2TS4]|nr:hypothetical protein J2TS4_33990 [Paenibacillus sp. J2TS4]